MSLPRCDVGESVVGLERGDDVRPSRVHAYSEHDTVERVAALAAQVAQVAVLAEQQALTT